MGYHVLFTLLSSLFTEESIFVLLINTYLYVSQNKRQN